MQLLYSKALLVHVTHYLQAINQYHSFIIYIIQTIVKLLSSRLYLKVRNENHSFAAQRVTA